MTKNEAIGEGNRDGGVAAETWLKTGPDVFDVDEDAHGVNARFVSELAATTAFDWIGTRKLRGKVIGEYYHPEFVRTFVAAWNAAWWEQPEAKDAQRQKSFWRKVESMKAQAETELARFKKRLDKDPMYAFEWGDGAVAAAAILKVVAEIEDERTYEGWAFADMVTRLSGRVLQLATATSMSTGQYHNLVHQQALAALAELVSVAERGR